MVTRPGALQQATNKKKMIKGPLQHAQVSGKHKNLAHRSPETGRSTVPLCQYLPRVW